MGTGAYQSILRCPAEYKNYGRETQYEKNTPALAPWPYASQHEDILE
jgi:hypothetical protein